ncbi:hypothetical protein DBR17_14735 [Sphingomonas sp. HMWF008]|nr:hypothetical protein DBR17_14735 [Sphingomonas sp. HMWF008]
MTVSGESDRLAVGGTVEAPGGAGQGGEIAQRVHLTIVFSDVSNSTGITAALEPEVYADLLQRMRDACERVTARHGGIIVRVDGDGVLSVYGHPTPHEDAARRAIEAAIDLHAALTPSDRELSDDHKLELHTGIHAGVALVRSGDLVRGRFEMLGDATNVAARLCDAARAGEIVVSQAALGGDVGYFSMSPREILHLKGRAQPISYHRVTGRVNGAALPQARRVRAKVNFVGRRDELLRLEKWRARTRRGAPRIVSIIGPAGMGKTRLANEFLERSERSRTIVHQAYCEAYLGAAPLQPIAQLAASLAGADASWMRRDSHGATASVIDALAAAASIQPDVALPHPTAIADALAELLASGGDARDVIVFIDDWQWADDASRQVIELLVAQSAIDLTVLLASRERDAGFAPAVGCETIHLAPLAVDDAIAAIEHLLPTPEPFLVTRVFDKAGGNPLFIEELCHALASGDDPLAPTDRTAWLDLLVQARCARLNDGQARLVRAASVLGNVFPHWLFSAVTGIAVGSPRITELAQEDFLFTGDVPGTLRFKHGLTRDAIYRTVALDERRRLHRAIVEALRERARDGQDEAALETLAYHQAAAGNFRDAAILSEHAGERALAAGALDRAQAQFRAAIEALHALTPSATRDRDMDRVVRRFGQASVVDPSREQLTVLERASERATRAGNVEGLAWCEYWLGFVLYGLGEPRLAIQRLRKAEAAADQLGDVKLRANIRATLGQAYAAACDYLPALSLLDEAIEIKRRHQTPDRPSIVLSYTLSCRALVFADQGRFEAAYADFDAAIDVLAGIEHEMTASVLTLRCAALLWQGRHDEAHALGVRSQAIAEQARARYIFVNCNSLINYPRWWLTRDPAALVPIVDATRWLENTSRQQFNSLNFGWLAQAMVELGRLDDARRYAARALLRARKGDSLGLAMAMRAMAMAAARGHGRRDPSHYLARANDVARHRGSAHELAQNLRCAGDIANLYKASDEAKRLHDEADAAFAALNMASFAVVPTHITDCRGSR